MMSTTSIIFEKAPPSWQTRGMNQLALHLESGINNQHQGYSPRPELLRLSG